MKHYLDTSVVVSLLINERCTAAVRDWLEHDADSEKFISEWTLTEFHSALSLKLRTGQISGETKGEAEEIFRQAQGTILDLVPVSSADFMRAAELAGNPNLWLRAGDALNLAIAERADAVMCTIDKRLFEAAEQIGMPAYMPS